MTRSHFVLATSLVAGLFAAHLSAQNAPSNAQKIQNAMSAGPAEIAKNAIVVDHAADGSMVELRKGTNGWTCLADMPVTPANDPMCLDKNAKLWADAWMAKKQPALSGVGIGYMLQGGSTADNDDPFAAKPPAGKDWLREPPHVMLFGVKIDPAVHSSEPNTARPWVMFKGTPYEHLMVPVK
jgi:hypothetical protein